MTLTLILLLPFLGSLCAAFLPSNARNVEAWLAGFVSVACVVLVASLLPEIRSEGVVRATLPWVPQLGSTSGCASTATHGCSPCW